MALGSATEACCLMGDEERAVRYYRRLTHPPYRKANQDLCAAKGIYLDEEARRSKAAIAYRVAKARADASDAQDRSDYRTMLSRAQAILSEAEAPADRELGHTFAVRAACMLGDAPLAQEHLAGLGDKDQRYFIGWCKMQHVELTDP